jgi:hypothetical protein
MPPIPELLFTVLRDGQPYMLARAHNPGEACGMAACSWVINEEIEGRLSPEAPREARRQIVARFMEQLQAREPTEEERAVFMARDYGPQSEVRLASIHL